MTDKQYKELEEWQQEDKPLNSNTKDIFKQAMEEAFKALIGIGTEIKDEIKMRELYICMPKEYIEALHKNNEREKARAFMEYVFDLENSNKKIDLEIYPVSWDVDLKVAHSWLKEFNEAIDKYTKEINKDNDLLYKQRH